MHIQSRPSGKPFLLARRDSQRLVADGAGRAAALALLQICFICAQLHSCVTQAATAEIEAGATGSASLRAAALGALHQLTEAVGSGDALAFFVPGLASGLGNALAAAGVYLHPL